MLSSFGFPSKRELRKFFEALMKSLNLPMFTLIGSLILIFKELVVRFSKSEDFEFYRREFCLSNRIFIRFEEAASEESTLS